MRRFLLAVVLAVLPSARPEPRARAGRRADPGGPRHARGAGDDDADRVAGPANTLRHARGGDDLPARVQGRLLLRRVGRGCVLLARAGNGTWSYPAFYGIGSGSVGFQFGIEDSAIMMMIMTDRGPERGDGQPVQAGRGCLGRGGDGRAAVSGGATTAAVGADILVFAESRGLFGGVSVEGSIMSLRSDWEPAYYGQPYCRAADRGADGGGAIRGRIRCGKC